MRENFAQREQAKEKKRIEKEVCLERTQLNGNECEMACEGNPMLKCKSGTIHSFVRLLTCSLVGFVLWMCLFGCFLSVRQSKAKI